jgi:hypothetical protein
MKAWPLLLLGLGACAEPPRRPPVTYVPIVRGPEAPPPPAGSAGSSQPSEKEGGTATSLVAVSTEAPPADDAATNNCYAKLANGCCGDAGVPGKKQGGKTVCPKGMVLRKSCKGMGRACK